MIAVVIAVHVDPRAILAAAGGTLFEAAPFALFAACAPPRFRRFAGLAGCGCNRGRAGAIPGALAPVAVAFAWLGFGPRIALVRVAAAIAVAAVVFLVRTRTGARPRGPDAAADESSGAADLPGIALAASIAAVLAGIAANHALSGPGAVALGLALGLLAPCATAGLALAAGLAGHAPGAAEAILAVAGIVPGLSLVPRLAGPRFGTRSVPGAFGRIALAVALGTLALRGPSGLVSPRLVPVVAAGAIAAVVSLRRARPAPGEASAAAVMVAAVVLGSPQPSFTATDAAVVDGYPGEAVRYTGVERGNRVVRFAIACCRLDARAVDIELARRAAADGAWIAVEGRFVERRGRLVVLPTRVRAVTAPADPYLYL